MRLCNMHAKSDIAAKSVSLAAYLKWKLCFAYAPNSKNQSRNWQAADGEANKPTAPNHEQQHVRLKKGKLVFSRFI